MAPRKNPKSGSPAPGARRETKHGNKNGKKEGVSGSSFFTWFMVIALLGVWTSVAVVWFELVDYEEVLAKAKDFRYNLSEVLQGKLGIYDADGDGDFDVEDAKILLGLKERSVLEQSTPRDAEEVIQQPTEQPRIRAEHRRSAEAEPEDEIQSLLREALNSQLGETDEEHEREETHFQQEENTETPEDTIEVPVVEEDYDRELEDKMPDILATPESFQEEPTSDHEVQEPEEDERHGMHEYDTDVEENTYEPVVLDASELNLEDALVDETDASELNLEDALADETDASELNLEDALVDKTDASELNLEDALVDKTDASELNLEDALVDKTETFPEHEEEQDYVDEHEMENEDYVETQDTDGQPVTEHYYEDLEEETLQAEPVDDDEQRNEHVDAPETISEHTESEEEEHEKDHMDSQPRETEVPTHTESHSKDDLVDT